LNAYVPKLAYAGGVASFFTKHRGATFASTCLADPISKGFVAAIDWYAAKHDIPFVRFATGGGREDDVALEAPPTPRRQVPSCRCRAHPPSKFPQIIGRLVATEGEGDDVSCERRRARGMHYRRSEPAPRLVRSEVVSPVIPGQIVS
jgi:hypothetical protein